MYYGVLKADIVNSRSYKDHDRFIVQEFLKLTVNYLNALYRETLKYQVQITSGDEIEGLFYHPAYCYLYQRLLKLLLYPVRIRSGIGYGQPYYETADNTNELDGPVYHYAREAIDLCKEKDLDTCFIAKSAADKHLNMMMLEAEMIRGNPSVMINLIAIAAELMFPLEGGVVVYDKALLFAKGSSQEQFREIIVKKIEIGSMGTDARREDISPLAKVAYDKLADMLLIDHGNVGCLIGSETPLAGTFWRKGFSTRIAEVLNTKRQIVDRNLGYCNYDYHRNLEATIVAYLFENYGGNLCK